MEPPHKRQRLSGSQIPDPDLRCRRAKNDRRLKSIFESIFDKYSKDFEGIGDEIDLRTGEIVVNNGHLLNITDETDVGQTNALSDISQDDRSSEEEEYMKETAQTLDKGTPGDGLGMTEAETSLQALYIVNSLVENAATEPSPACFRESLLEQVGRSSPEEDELADKTIEWVTPREARAIAHGKWQLPDCGPTFKDDSAVEEAWRAPPLGDLTPTRQSLDSVAQDALRMDKSSPSNGAPLPRKRRNLGRVAHAELNAANCLQTRIPTKALRYAGFARLDRLIIPWTTEEEDQLRHLKASTDLTYRRMEHFFPKRNCNSIATKWSQMRKNGTQQKRRPLHVSPLASYTTALMVDRDQQPLSSVVQKANDSLSELGSHLDDSFHLHLQKLDGSHYSENKAASVQHLNLVAPSTSMNRQNMPEEHGQGVFSQHPRVDHAEKHSMVQSSSSLSTLSTQHVIDQFKDRLDLQYETPQTNPNLYQDESAGLCSSKNSRGFSEDAARRRKKLIETLDPEYFEVVGENDTPSLQESQGPSIMDLPALHAQTGTSFASCSLRSQSGENTAPETIKATGACRYKVQEYRLIIQQTVPVSNPAPKSESRVHRRQDGLSTLWI